MNNCELGQRANEIRKNIIKILGASGSGHPGGSLSAADILTVLYFDELNIDPEDPGKKDRDFFILSKGHAAPVLYSTLGLRGYFPIEETMTLRKIGSNFQGHPDMRKVKGVEMSTGSLGQGFSVAVGAAIGFAMFKDENRVYCLLGDGENQEGLIWEAAMAAGHYKLDNLVAILDNNGLQIDGDCSKVMTVEPLKDKWEAFGFNVLNIDGHNIDEIKEALKKARKFKGKPTMIIAKTIKGKGVSFMENQAKWHGVAPNEGEVKEALEELIKGDRDDCN